MRTIKDIDDAKQDLRIWCFRCARGERIDAIIWELFEARGWPADLPEASVRFRCKVCRKSDQVLVVPATRPYVASSVNDYIGALFHGFRSQRKAEKREGKKVPRRWLR